MVRIPIAISLLLVCTVVQADAYKCKMPDGHVVISSEPCGGDSRTEAVRPSEKISPEQRREAELRVARDRERLADQEKARAEEEKRLDESRRQANDDDAARKSRCVDNAQSEPDPVLRANLIAACNGVAPAPTVVHQPVYLPAPAPPRPKEHPSAVQLCVGKGCTGPQAPPGVVSSPGPGSRTIEPGRGSNRCRVEGGVRRCD